MLQKIQEKYNYTDYQMRVLKYVFTVFIGEFGKIVIMGCLFLKCYPLYLCCVLLLGTLRPSTGGVHCRTYLGCLAASAGYFALCIYALPYIPVSLMIRIGLLIACMGINYLIGPVVSKKHKPLSEKAIRNSLIRSFAVVSCFTIFTLVNPYHKFAIAGFWIVIVNSVQLVIAKILRKEKKS